MKPKELFGLGVRLFGLFLGRSGLACAYDYWYLGHSRLQQQGELGYNLVFCGVYLVAAAYFVAGAPHLVKYSYPEPEPPADSETTTPKADDKPIF
jgi:hypothetical protein